MGVMLKSFNCAFNFMQKFWLCEKEEKWELILLLTILRFEPVSIAHAVIPKEEGYNFMCLLISGVEGFYVGL
jgi:hypothetical protein